MLANQTNNELLPDARVGQNRSCDQCRRRKIKCDFNKPQCFTCDRRNKICTYNDPVRKRGPKPRLSQGGGFLDEQDGEQEPDADEDLATAASTLTLQEGGGNGTTPTKNIPIPIKISFAEDVTDSNEYSNGISAYSPGSSYSPSELSASPYSLSNLFVSPGTSPSSSINVAFSDICPNSPSFLNSDLDSLTLDGLDYAPLPQLGHKRVDSASSQHSLILDQMYGQFDPVTVDSSTALFPTEMNQISRLTELETFLLSIYYQNIHQALPLIPYETIQPMLPFIDQDFSIRFLINCMCASAASSSSDPNIAEHLPTFYSLAINSAPFVIDRTAQNFNLGASLLQTYFNISV